MRRAPLAHFEEILEASAHVVAVQGELDFSSAGDFKRSMLSGLAAGRERLVADLSQVRFIDSSGIRALLDIKRRTRLRGGQLAVVCPDESVWSRFTVASLDQLLEICATREEALSRVTAA
jgi:anti-anti-sigma factor